MSPPDLPRTDSIAALAAFWDAHDVTEFDDQLEEVGQPVFVRPGGEARVEIKVPLDGREVDAVDRIADAQGVTRERLVREWVRQRLARPAEAGRAG